MKIKVHKSLTIEQSLALLHDIIHRHYGLIYNSRYEAVTLDDIVVRGVELEVIGRTKPTVNFTRDATEIDGSITGRYIDLKCNETKFTLTLDYNTDPATLSLMVDGELFITCSEYADIPPGMYESHVTASRILFGESNNIEGTDIDINNYRTLVGLYSYDINYLHGLAKSINFSIENGIVCYDNTCTVSNKLPRYNTYNNVINLLVDIAKNGDSLLVNNTFEDITDKLRYSAKYAAFMLKSSKHPELLEIINSWLVNPTLHTIDTENKTVKLVTRNTVRTCRYSDLTPVVNSYIVDLELFERFVYG